MDYEKSWYELYGWLGSQARLRMAQSLGDISGAIAQEAEDYMIVRRRMRDFDESLVAEDGTDEI